ncbi:MULTISPECIES: hypothetical protein [unclassified Streptomyces]|uniref:hypothetical protein n=1 Tax=unclassified Streptomyces TaxID=2593676 RepID=UPI0022B71F18|nr:MULTISPECIES: hypothetical protein [unclassified Streptomyces]MCZ7414821.1 hypothetical protein [Streptomyces sp. WMMC897]MCZ7431765.1 hypothetical protein [Streptomyces sp. WMMC1477]
MQALTAIIAVLGTLFGSSLTYLFQRRITERARELEERTRVRQERLDAFAAYAGALFNYRRLAVHRWFVVNERPGSEDVNALTREMYQLRTEAVEAEFRVQLLTDDEGIRQRASEAMRSITELHDVCNSREVMDAGRGSSRSAINAFVTTARPLVRGTVR